MYGRSVFLSHVPTKVRQRESRRPWLDTIFLEMCPSFVSRLDFVQCGNHQIYFSDINLSVIGEYKKQFPDINIGYSGHELGFIPTLGAVAKGAKVVERHFTLDKSLKGTSIYYVSTSWYKGIVLLTYLVTF